MRNKLTAVDWLIEQMLNERLKFIYTEMGVFWEQKYDIIEKAKQMEKEQIMDAYDSGEANHYRTNFIMDFVTDYNGDVSPEEFYNKTYGK